MAKKGLDAYGKLSAVFSDVQFAGSFVLSEIYYDYFESYSDDTSLLRAMFGLLFSNAENSSLTMEPGRVYNVSGQKLDYGHALLEFYDKSNKEINGNGAVINDLRPRSLVGYSSYDGVLLFSHCDNIIIHNLIYQNLNEDFDLLYDEQGNVKYKAGIENQLGYVGTSFILLQNNCSHFEIVAHIVGARYGVKMGDYSKYWLSGDQGLTDSRIEIIAERTGYPVAIELGDGLDIFVESDTHHRAAYLCGISNSKVQIKAKNIMIGDRHCMLSDTHFSVDEYSPMRFKACQNLDVSLMELGSQIVTNKNAFCVGFQTFNNKPFYSRKESLTWSNIKVKIHVDKECPNVGLFTFSRGKAKNSSDPLNIQDYYENISITANNIYPTKQYSARLLIGETARYSNISIQVDAPEGIVIYNNENDYEFDLSSSAVGLINYSGKVILPKKVKSKKIKF